VLPFPSLAPERIEVIRRQADLLALSLIDAELPTRTGPLWEQENHHLLSAASIAVANKCDLVVWPESAALGDNLDLDRIAQVADRALLVGRLTAVDSKEHGVASIRIEAPYADFTDKQIAELALDMAAPIEACWWWGGPPAAGRSGTTGPAIQRERARWTDALRAVGWSPLSV